MPLVNEVGTSFATAKAAAKDVSQKMARKLAERHREYILAAFKAQPGGRAGPSNDSFDLHDSLKVRKVSGQKNAVELIALKYWRFVMEFGSWLEVKTRRINPPLLVSTASEEVWQKAEEIVKTDLEVFAVRVTGASTGAR